MARDRSREVILTLGKTVLKLHRSRKRDMNGFSGTNRAIVEQCCPNQVSNLRCLADIRREHLGQA